MTAGHCRFVLWSIAPGSPTPVRACGLVAAVLQTLAALVGLHVSRGDPNPDFRALDAPEISFSRVALVGGPIPASSPSAFDLEEFVIESGAVVAEVTGPGLLSFEWRLSGLGSQVPIPGPPLEFLLDGEVKASTVDGEWASVTVQVPSGSHGLRWRRSPEAGLEPRIVGLLNKVWFRRSIEESPIPSGPTSVDIPEGLPAMLGYPLRITPKSARWMHHGSPVPNAASASLRMAAPVPGSYTLEISDGARFWTSGPVALQVTKAVTIDEVLRLPPGSTTSGGAAPWNVSWEGYPPPAGAARLQVSPPASVPDVSWLEASITGPGILKNTWSHVAMTADTIPISDGTNEVWLPEGTHTYRWSYGPTPSFEPVLDSPIAWVRPLQRESDVPVVAPGVTLATNAYGVFAGNRLELTAIVTGRPVPEVRWIHDGVVRAQSFFNHVLSLSPARLEDGGSWRLEVRNGAGSSSFEFSLMVVKSPLERTTLAGFPGSGVISATGVDAAGDVLMGIGNGIFRVRGNAVDRLPLTFTYSPRTSGIFSSPTLNTLVGLADGRILVSGPIATVNGVPAPRVMILGASGAVDPTFAPEVATFPRLTNAQFVVSAPLPGGRFIVNQGLHDARPGNLLTVFLPNGAVDSAFNPDPTRWPGVSPSQIPAYETIHCLSTGEILLGSADPTVVSSHAFARMDAEGNYVGNDPVGRLPVSRESQPYPQVSAILVFNDDSFLLGGSFKTHAESPVIQGVLRVTRDGAVDAGFGREVKPNVLDLFPLSDGSVVVAGLSEPLVLLRSDGRVDPWFRARGVVQLGIDRAYHVSVDARGRIVTGEQRPVLFAGNGTGVIVGAELGIVVAGPRVILHPPNMAQPHWLEQGSDLEVWSPLGTLGNTLRLPRVPSVVPAESPSRFFRVRPVARP